MNRQTDSDLVARTLCGEKDAFGELAERYAPMVRKIAATMTPDQDLAHDLGQEALLQAYLSLRHLRDRERFASWLYGITLNVCRGYFRDRKINYLSLDSVMGGMHHGSYVLTDPTPSPERIAEERDLHDRVIEAVNLLSPGNRAAVMLYYYDSLTLHEIAALLGISAGAVKGRLHKSRQQLHDHLIRTLAGESMALEGRNQMAVPVTILDVTNSEDSSVDTVVLLADETGQRYLPIWVGPYEANSVALHLTGEPVPRPMTYEFIGKLLDAVGAEVEEVRIEALREDVFYAVVRVRDGDASHEIDARPSDGINIALRAGSPITVSEEVLDKAGLTLPEARDAHRGRGAEKMVNALKEQFARREQEYKERHADEEPGAVKQKHMARLQAYLMGESDAV